MTVSVTQPETQTLQRRINLLDAVMLSMGSMIGSGIFFVPASIAVYLQSTAWYLGIWIVGGLVSLLGALSLAELGASLPQAGGQYVYIRRAYGPVLGFLSGWSSFAVIMTASISAVAVACAQCIADFIPLNTQTIQWVAIAMIWGLTGINILGVEAGTRVQNTMTGLKIGALVAIIILGLCLSGGNWTHFTAVSPSAFWENPWSATGLAMIGVLWAYDGWIQVTYVAGEIREPQHNLPRALWISTLAVIALYTLINAVYVYVLSLPAMANQPIVASETARILLGPTGKTLVSLAILISTFGANNGFIFGGARIYYAMAKDGAFFPAVGTLNQAGVPVVSLLVQAVWASLLIFTGSYEQLFTYVIFAAWLSYALAASAVFILRKREPDLPRPYQTWGYPFTPVLFIACATGLVINTIISAPRDSLIGLGIVLLGLPAYWYCRRHMKR